MNGGINYPEVAFKNIAHDLDALEKHATEFPFSSLTQYLLLHQYRKDGHAGFEKLLKRTALYFNNHNWLQFQLAQIDSSKTPAGNLHANIYETGTNENQHHFAVATDEDISLHQSPNMNALEDDSIPDTESLGWHMEHYQEPETQFTEENDFDVAGQNSKEIIPDSETLGTHIDNLQHTEIHDDYEDLTSEKASENEATNHQTQYLGTHIENIGNDGQASNEMTAVEVYNNEAAPDSEISQLGKEDIEPANLTDEALTETVPANNTDEVKNPGIAEPIAFEPLHTVDYFASLGIKITEEPLANDKLGAQMKSFTEWLKSMKKLHVEKMPEENSLAEDIIQSAAEVSNIDTEVLTEAMAEVLIKQNKKEKAIEMYSKLSLINPSKSAYFAGKIESIKST
ncbi:MAG: hypothetical protein ABJA90_04710 [Ginsengibacter sp.]